MNETKELPKFTPFRKLADFDYGVKGLEIRFQEMIEEYLEKRGIEEPWWKYYPESIFWEILEIYQREEKEQQCNILIYLHEYCEKITKEVSDRVKNNTPVTMEERKELERQNHPELFEGSADA